MQDSLLFVTLGLLIALAALERLASRALVARQAAWRAHYAAVPRGATVAAELRWHGGNWITAFIDPRCGPGQTLRLVAQHSLPPREQAACLRWLRAEGFAEQTACRTPDSGF